MPDITPGVYRHFKGKLYLVFSIATHTETNEQLVDYVALYPPYSHHCRPLNKFLEPAEKRDWKEVKIFELVKSMPDLEKRISDFIQTLVKDPSFPKQ